MTDAREIVKTIQDSAKLGENGQEIASRAGCFFAKILKEPEEEVSSMVEGKLRFIRCRLGNVVKMSDNVNTILLEKGISQTRAVSPKIALSIIEESSLEEDSNLQFLWSHLLTNALDPNFNDEIRYGFIEMIKGITGLEAKLLSEFYEILKNKEQLYPIENISEYGLTKEEIIKLIGFTPGNYLLSVNNLMRMQLISPAIIKTGMSLRKERVTVYKGTDIVTLTPLGIKFVEACMK